MIEWKAPDRIWIDGYERMDSRWYWYDREGDASKAVEYTRAHIVREKLDEINRRQKATAAALNNMQCTIDEFNRVLQDEWTSFAETRPEDGSSIWCADDCGHQINSAT